MAGRLAELRLNCQLQKSTDAQYPEWILGADGDHDIFRKMNGISRWTSSPRRRFTESDGKHRWFVSPARKHFLDARQAHGRTARAPERTSRQRGVAHRLERLWQIHHRHRIGARIVLAGQTCLRARRR